MLSLVAKPAVSASATSAVAVAGRRLFSSSLRAFQETASAAGDGAGKHGTFATFAEYRQAIIKRDPVTMETRNKVMAPHERKVAEPEGEKAEDQGFRDLAKKVAY